jgi:glycosyltransferase involved in cell wall biosynthesis
MKVALVIWTNPDYYQGVIYTAQIMSEAGHDVEILCCNTNESFFGRVDYGVLTKVLRIGSRNRGLRNYANFLKFIFNLASRHRRRKYDLVIGYDMFGIISAFLMTRLGKKPVLVYHNFDLVDRKHPGLLFRFLKQLEYTAAGSSRAVVLSSRGRAQIFKEKAKLAFEPLVVMNCERVRGDFKNTGEFRQILQKNAINVEKTVIRLGSIGPGHAIEATIRSVKYWQGNWGLVFLGVPLGDYLVSMRQLVSQLGLGGKVMFMPFVSYELWNDCLYSADAGVALYEPVNINHQTMAGAGQKTSFYLKAGIPSILPDLPDFVAMLDKYKFGVLADPADPRSIAKAVNDLLGDAKRYADLSRAAKDAFLSEFNFEKQFSAISGLIT